MDRKLHALVTRDVLTETVRIDVRGSLNEESRPSLVQLVTRVRSMGFSSRILVDLSGAALVESAALAGLRDVLNALDGTSEPESAGAGVSLVLNAVADGASDAVLPGVQSLLITDLLTDGSTDGPAPALGGVPAGNVVPAGKLAPEPAAGAEGPINPAGRAMLGHSLGEFSDDELFAASDAFFASLDNPEAFGGSDLLALYNDVGEEISRRNLLRGFDEPAADGTYEPAAEGQVAS